MEALKAEVCDFPAGFGRILEGLESVISFRFGKDFRGERGTTWDDVHRTEAVPLWPVGGEKP